MNVAECFYKEYNYSSLNISFKEDLIFMLKKVFPVLCLICLTGILVSCQVGPPDSETIQDAGPEPIHGTVAGASDLNLMQAGPPQAGDTLVILHTNMGDITLRLFPDEAPMAYENFVTHARDGYYDGVIFHRIIENFMIQGGDPEGTGAGGESIWGHGFGPEFSRDLRHFRGALAMAQSAMPNSIGSQFYIVQNSGLDPQTIAEFDFLRDHQDESLGLDHDGEAIYVRDLFPIDKLEAYIRYGGTPHLDLVMNEAGHTVFGQVVAGMGVVDAIAAVDVDGAGRPANDVIIESVTVTTH